MINMSVFVLLVKTFREIMGYLYILDTLQEVSFIV